VDSAHRPATGAPVRPEETVADGLGPDGSSATLTPRQRQLIEHYRHMPTGTGDSIARPPADIVHQLALHKEAVTMGQVVTHLLEGSATTYRRPLALP
jgi:hypothetical protein